MSALTLLAAEHLRGLQITAVGIGVVFTVLGLLCLVLIAFQYIFGEDKPSEPGAVKPTPSEEPSTPAVTEAPPLDSRVPAIIIAAVTHVLGRVPENIEIRRAGESRGDGRRTAAIVAATLAHLDETPGSIHIRKV